MSWEDVPLTRLAGTAVERIAPAPEATVAAIRALPGEFEFVTYVSLTCQNCPDVVQSLNLMAVLNPNITHTMVEGSMYQAEVEAAVGYHAAAS